MPVDSPLLCSNLCPQSVSYLLLHAVRSSQELSHSHTGSPCNPGGSHASAFLGQMYLLTHWCDRCSWSPHPGSDRCLGLETHVLDSRGSCRLCLRTHMDTGPHSLPQLVPSTALCPRVGMHTIGVCHLHPRDLLLRRAALPGGTSSSRFPRQF